VAFRPDGARVASGSADGAVKLWDVFGKEWATYHGHPDGVRSVAFNSDGTRLVSADRETAKVWDATTPPGVDFAPPWSLRSAAFSLNGERLATGNLEGNLQVWDRATGRLVLTTQGHTGDVVDLAFRPDGKEFASVSEDRSVKLWDAADGRLLRAFPLKEKGLFVLYSPNGTRLAIRTHNDDSLRDTVRVLEAATGREEFSCRPEGFGVAFSPDGQRLAIGGYPDHAELASIVDLATRRPVVTLRGLSEEILNLAWHRDRVAAISLDGGVKVWDATGELKWTLPLYGSPSREAGIAFSPDGERLVTVTARGDTKVWELTEGKEVLTFRTGNWVLMKRVAAFSSDGRYLFLPRLTADARVQLAADARVQVLDGGRGPLALALRGQQETNLSWTAVAFSPDGRWLAGGSNSASLWNAVTGEELTPLPPSGNNLRRLTFSPDSSLLAAATTNRTLGHLGEGTVKVWDVAGRKEVLTFRDPSGIQDIAFSPDGRRLASAAYDRTVKVWESRTGRVELTLRNEKAGFTGVAFSPDGGRLAAADAGPLVQVWEAGSGRQVLVCGAADGRGVYWAVAFSPDGRYLVGGGSVITVWDVATSTEGRQAGGKEVRTLAGGPNYLGRIAFSRDGKLLAAAGRERVVVWDFASGREVLTYPVRGTTGGTDVAFSPDGTRLAIGGGPGLDVWEVGEKWQALEAARQRDSRERVRTWHRQQATDSWGFAARFHSSWLIALEPNEGGHYALRAEANASLDRWVEAAADAARAVELLPDDPRTWHRQALLHLRAGNAAGYHETCEALVKRLGQTTDPTVANDVAWACCLAPGATSDPKTVVTLAERAVAKEASSERLGTLGAALCRAGRHDEGVIRLREAIKGHAKGGSPLDWFVLALAHHHLKQPDKAREAFARGQAQENEVHLATWQSRLEVKLLRAEADKLLAEKKP
jgi:WD40 repeat protein